MFVARETQWQERDPSGEAVSQGTGSQVRGTLSFSCVCGTGGGVLAAVERGSMYFRSGIYQVTLSWRDPQEAAY